MEALKQRDFLFDNAKGLLAFLVVFSHITQHANFVSQEFVDYINRGIFMFHMPVFIFISGYFSKKHKPRSILNLFALYFVWQMGIAPMVYSILKGIPFADALKPLFLPQATYWYLLSLIIWRVITPYFSMLKGGFVISIMFGLLVGLSDIKADLQYFSYARTVAFYPFFLLGFYCTKERFYAIKDKFKKHWGFIAFIGVLAIGIALMYAVYPLLVRETRAMRLLVGKFKYETYYNNPYTGIWVSGLIYLVRFAAVFLFFTFIPKTKGILTRLGNGSLFIYLTHWWVISYLENKYFQDVSYENGYLVIGFAFVATCFYCWLLTTKPFLKLGYWMTNIKIDWLLKKDEVASVEK